MRNTKKCGRKGTQCPSQVLKTPGKKSQPESFAVLGSPSPRQPSLTHSFTADKVGRVIGREGLWAWLSAAGMKPVLKYDLLKHSKAQKTAVRSGYHSIHQTERKSAVCICSYFCEVSKLLYFTAVPALRGWDQTAALSRVPEHIVFKGVWWVWLLSGR